LGSLSALRTVGALLLLSGALDHRPYAAREMLRELTSGWGDWGLGGRIGAHRGDAAGVAASIRICGRPACDVRADYGAWRLSGTLWTCVHRQCFNGGLVGRVWDMLLGRKARGIACVASLSFWATPGIAANISLAPLDNDPAHAVVLLEGPLVSGDDAAFRSHVGRLTKAVVTFDSDGRSLLAGIAIGKTIRLKSFVTAVIDGQRCASACALAWLGGSPRLMGTRAYIGFHAAYVDKAGRASETGVGNALVGASLTQIGLSESAVVYITQAAPTDMTWLTLRDAERIGIDVVPWALDQAPAAKPAQPKVASRETGERDVASRAASFVAAINSKWSGTNAGGLDWLNTLYAQEVDFYGKRLTRQAVIAEKRRFSERWPERDYSIQTNSMKSQCSSSECIVTGNVQWETRSIARGATASGLATFTYFLVPSGSTFVVKGENGGVIQRR
jgi:hypothetical protein